MHDFACRMAPGRTRVYMPVCASWYARGQLEARGLPQPIDSAHDVVAPVRGTVPDSVGVGREPERALVNPRVYGGNGLRRA